MNVVLSMLEKIIQILNDDVYKDANKYAYDSGILTSRRKLLEKLGMADFKKKQSSGRPRGRPRKNI